MSGERNQYQEFLKQHALGISVDQIAEQWKRSVRLVRRDLRKLGIAVPRRQLDPASLERLRSSAQASQRRRWADWKEEKRQLRFRRREEVRDQGEQIEERTCEKCGERWHLTREFFREKYNLRHGVERKFFSRSCVLCRP